MRVYRSHRCNVLLCNVSKKTALLSSSSCIILVSLVRYSFSMKYVNDNSMRKHTLCSLFLQPLFQVSSLTKTYRNCYYLFSPLFNNVVTNYLIFTFLRYFCQHYRDRIQTSLIIKHNFNFNDYSNNELISSVTQ